MKAALFNWLMFVKEVADIDTRISFDVTVSISSESNLLMIWGTFNGQQEELGSLFNSWLTKSPKANSFSVFNYTQIDINEQVGISIPFPMMHRQHVVSAMVIDITNSMLDIILESQGNSNISLRQVMHIVYLRNADRDNNTAWPFSDVSFVIAPVFEWLTPDVDYIAIHIATNWLQRLFNAAASSQSIVGSYVNYIDPYLKDWQKMYYRHHWNRLREIKIQWDPTDYFRFPQGISPHTKESNTAKWRNNISLSLVGFIFIFKFHGLTIDI